MKRHGVTTVIVLVCISLVCLVAAVPAEEYEALQGVTAAKAVFDEREAKPKSAVLHLKLIHQTYKDLKEMKKNPAFAVIFIGPSVKLISTNRSGFSAEDQKALAEVAGILSAMAKDGIVLEVCMVAVKVAGVDPATILPEIAKKGNGWISEIGYQAQGYSLVPVY